MRKPKLYQAIFFIGLCTLATGAGMRAVARISMGMTEQRLIAARPTAPTDINVANSRFSRPADAPPTRISLPALGLWNALQPVDEQAAEAGNQIDLTWDVADAGWHEQSAWPGWNGNVVIAGHSPSLDPATWSHSIFRQLAYLQPHDLIELTAGSRIYRYSVSAIFAIPADEVRNPDATAWLDRGSTERLTLITCWPPNTAAYRIIVIAQPSGSGPSKE